MQVTNYFYNLSTKYDFCHVFGSVKNCKLQSLQNVQNKKRTKHSPRDCQPRKEIRANPDSSKKFINRIPFNIFFHDRSNFFCNHRSAVKNLPAIPDLTTIPNLHTLQISLQCTQLQSHLHFQKYFIALFT